MSVLHFMNIRILHISKNIQLCAKHLDVSIKTLRVLFFGKNPNPDSEPKKEFFVSLVKSKNGLYESNESARDEDSMD